MADTYSLYEAKTHLSAIIRRVRDGRPATITLHGEPVAEIRALSPPEEGIEERMAQLVERGVIVGAPQLQREIRTFVRRKGALKRFLKDRDE